MTVIVHNRRRCSDLLLGLVRILFKKGARIWRRSGHNPRAQTREPDFLQRLCHSAPGLGLARRLPNLSFRVGDDE